MSYSTTAWAALDRWSQVAFLAAGGLFMLPTAAYGVGVVTGTEIYMSPAVVFLFALVIFVGLLGLYPRLADRDSTLAKGALGLLVATVTIIVSILGVSVLPGELTGGKSTFFAIVATVVVGSTLTITSFGVASLRTGVYSRQVGSFLLVTGTAMALTFVAMLVFGDPTPAWVSFVVNGLIAMSLGAVGLALRTEKTPTESTESTDDVTAS